MVLDVIFCFKRKTADEMRISDWGSDVCSSDLPPPRRPAAGRRRKPSRRGDDRALARYQAAKRHGRRATPDAEADRARRALRLRVRDPGCGNLLEIGRAHV